MSAEKTHNRWLIAIMGTLLQMCLGTVYAWSYFQKPLVEGYGWSNAAVAGAFSTAICFLGLAAAWGGINLAKYGPTKLAMGGGALFGIGYLIGAYALNVQSIILLYIGYGVIGGSGLGLGYVTPVATCAKWFPDKKGFITGMVVMGFGLGALLMSLVFAPRLMAYTQGSVMQVFGYLGVIFLVLTVPIGSFMKNPPAGYLPEGYTPPPAPVSSTGKAMEEVIHPTMHYIMSKKFIIMWLIFFCNITAGIAIIGFQSPLLQDLYINSDPTYTVVKELRAVATPSAEQKATLDGLVKALAGFGATLIAITSLFNGLGRFFWGGLSDKIGRVQAFRLLVGTQILVFVALAYVGNPWLFGLLFCYILLCYGGGFGTMPSFVLDVYGPKMMSTVYGIILTAWSAAGIVGPQFAGIIKDKFPAQASLYTFWAGAGVLTVGLILAFLIGNEKFDAGHKEAEEPAKA